MVMTIDDARAGGLGAAVRKKCAGSRGGEPRARNFRRDGPLTS